MSKAMQGPYRAKITASEPPMIVQESGWIVARVSEHESEEVEQATAHLLAASWEMLEALKTMRREFFNNGIDGLSTRQAAALGNAAHVIAKAEGK